MQKHQHLAQAGKSIGLQPDIPLEQRIPDDSSKKPREMLRYGGKPTGGDKVFPGLR
jgi:hypothetical protein